LIVCSHGVCTVKFVNAAFLIAHQVLQLQLRQNSGICGNYNILIHSLLAPSAIARAKEIINDQND